MQPQQTKMYMPDLNREKVHDVEDVRGAHKAKNLMAILVVSTAVAALAMAIIAVTTAF